RLGAAGQIDTAQDPDYYRFSLAAGQSSTLALKSSVGSGTLTLYKLNGDGSTTELALGSGPSTSETNQTITDFIAPTSGTYVVAVNGDGTAYDLAVVRGAELQAPPSAPLTAPTDISGTGQALGNLAARPAAITKATEPNDSISQANDLSGSFVLSSTPNT